MSHPLHDNLATTYPGSVLNAHYSCHPRYAQPRPPHLRIAPHPTDHAPFTNPKEPTHMPLSRANIHTQNLNCPPQSHTCCPTTPHLNDLYTTPAPQPCTTKKPHSPPNLTELHHPVAHKLRDNKNWTSSPFSDSEHQPGWPRTVALMDMGTTTPAQTPQALAKVLPMIQNMWC